MIRFTVIGDFHYNKRQYATTVADMERIVENSHEENVDFILHVGDLSTDYSKSNHKLTFQCLPQCLSKALKG